MARSKKERNWERENVSWAIHIITPANFSSSKNQNGKHIGLNYSKTAFWLVATWSSFLEVSRERAGSTQLAGIIITELGVEMEKYIRGLARVSASLARVPSVCTTLGGMQRKHSSQGRHTSVCMPGGGSEVSWSRAPRADSQCGLTAAPLQPKEVCDCWRNGNYNESS